MEEQLAHIQSVVTSDVKRRLLFKGTCYAGLGAALLLLGGMYVPVAVMSYIGLPLLFISGGLILWGMVPYVRLAQLTSTPDHLVVTGDRQLHYVREGKPFLSVPLSAVDRLSYCDEGAGRYGIVADLVEGGIHQVSLHQQGGHMRRYLHHCKTIYHCDLFFPYFTQKGYREISGV